MQMIARSFSQALPMLPPHTHTHTHTHTHKQHLVKWSKSWYGTIQCSAFVSSVINLRHIVLFLCSKQTSPPCIYHGKYTITSCVRYTQNSGNENITATEDGHATHVSSRSTQFCLVLRTLLGWWCKNATVCTDNHIIFCSQFAQLQTASNLTC